MNWNEVYEKNKHRKYREIIDIKKSTDLVDLKHKYRAKRNIVLKGRVANLFKKHKFITSISLIIITIILILNFYSNLKALSLIFLMYFILLILIMFYNTYTIKYTDNKVYIKTNMQQINFDFKDLKNIYLEKTKIRYFIKQRNTYSLVILYKTPKEDISTIEFPVIFLRQNDVDIFLDNFIISEDKCNNIQKAREYNIKRLLIKVGLFIIVWIAIIISLLLNVK